MAIITVKVQPKSSQRKAVLSDNLVKLYINAPPVDGKANEDCIKLLSETLHIPKSSINILKGLSGRNKTIDIKNISNEEIFSILRGNQ